MNPGIYPTFSDLKKRTTFPKTVELHYEILVTMKGENTYTAVFRSRYFVTQDLYDFFQSFLPC